MSGKITRHDENIARLARVEGQVRGVSRMIEQGEYCIDIITQIQAARSALKAISLKVLEKHLDHCVKDAFKARSKRDSEEKIQELIQVIKRSY